jgi:hypothetical protein
LNIERRAETVFNDFHEGYISFLPTYKYQPGDEPYMCDFLVK